MTRRPTSFQRCGHEVCSMRSNGLGKEDREIAATRWSDATRRLGATHPVGWCPDWRPHCRFEDVVISAEVAFAPIQRIGGRHRLVLRDLALAYSWLARFARGRSRDAAWTSRSRELAGWRAPRFLASRSHLSPAGCLRLASGNACSRAGVAGIRSHRNRRPSCASGKRRSSIPSGWPG